jgi:predicted amidophosphoribosyltransferase
MSRLSGVPMLDDVMRRVRATPQQVGLKRAQRASNVEGAFAVPSDRRPDIRGKRLIVVDDVLTSGATADTCARALLRGGAATVDVIVFARVVDSVRAPI